MVATLPYTPQGWRYIDCNRCTGRSDATRAIPLPWERGLSSAAWQSF